MASRPPHIFMLFAAFWQLPEPQMRRLWDVLGRSRYSAPTALRQAWLLYQAAPIFDIKSLVHAACAPERIIGVLEALVLERLLSRAEATEFEEYILKCTKDGHWY